MQKIHTHYDNLKVSRDAPTEVIRAAYKSLSQKYHPDRNPNNPDSIRIMSIINASYDVLSDSQKRKEHDDWIAEQSRVETTANPERQNSNRNTKTRQKNITIGIAMQHVLRNWFIYLILASWLFSVLSTKTAPQSNSTKSYTPDPPSYNSGAFDDLIPPEKYKPKAQEFFTESNLLKSPNGESWPLEADYVNGYQKLNTDGLSSVTVDNQQNDSDVFVKLIFLGNENEYPVRQFYIPAHNKFTLENVSPGLYDIRYRNLVNGKLSKSESFELKEIEDNRGTQFSRYTITLYKVRNGNMRTYPLSENEF